MKLCRKQLSLTISHTGVVEEATEAVKAEVVLQLLQNSSRVQMGNQSRAQVTTTITEVVEVEAEVAVQKICLLQLNKLTRRCLKLSEN